MLNEQYSFLFESLGGKEDHQKTIYSSKPLEVFHSLEEAEAFLHSNYHQYKDASAGLAGYISYEGDCELAFYEDIKTENTRNHGILEEELNNLPDLSLKIEEPDPQIFLNAILRCKEHIRQGDIYQANLTRKFLVKNLASNSGIKQEELGQAIYSRLRKSNPAPYSGYMNFGKYQIISSSPESFIKTYWEEDKLKISSSPIKGTANLGNKVFLENSAKDKAEHLMILDLERNDLGRICQTGSIKVDELMGIYRFENLYHYISTVSGNLREELYQEGLSLSAIADACFPGGSITGAPKIRAMEIIRELEPVTRGPYTGAMGYIKFNGESEFNILIRSILIDKETEEISFHVGGGIVADSEPEAELEETRLKSAKLCESLVVFSNQVN